MIRKVTNASTSWVRTFKVRDSKWSVDKETGHNSIVLSHECRDPTVNEERFACREDNRDVTPRTKINLFSVAVARPVNCFTLIDSGCEEKPLTCSHCRHEVFSRTESEIWKCF